MPAYNVWREQCGLHRFTNWAELLQVMDDDTVGRLVATYRYSVRVTVEIMHCGAVYTLYKSYFYNFIELEQKFFQ